VYSVFSNKILHIFFIIVCSRKVLVCRNVCDGMRRRNSVKGNTSYIVHESNSLILTNTNTYVCVCVLKTMKTNYYVVKLLHMV